AVDHVTLTLGTFVNVTGGSGQIIVSPRGVAGSFTATATLTLPGLSPSGGTFKLAINSTTADVTEAFTVGSTTRTLTLPAGPYVSVEVLGLKLAFDADNFIHGDFAFDQKDGVTRVAVTGLDISIAGDSVLVGGEGAFVVKATGIAGYFSGKADVGP